MDDFLFKRKYVIPVQMTPKMHDDFKCELLRKRLSPQEVFEELVRLISTGDKTIHRLIDNYATSKMLDSMVTLTPAEIAESELDRESLYDLINDGEDI